MRPFAPALAALVLAGTLVTPAAAQSTSTDTANGSVTIVQPLTVTRVSDLSFGRIVKPTAGSGSVVLANTADTVSAGSGAVALAGISTTRARFDIAGEGGQLVTLTVPASVSLANSTNAITVTLSPSLAPSYQLSGTLGSSVTDALYVGGSFSLPSTQASGLYTGQFSVTAAYQ